MFCEDSTSYLFHGMRKSCKLLVVMTADHDLDNLFWNHSLWNKWETRAPCSTRNEKYLVTVTTACYNKATENNKKLHTGLNHTDMF